MIKSILKTWMVTKPDFGTIQHTMSLKEIFSECDCDEDRSSGCNQMTGTCICNPGWTGDKCQGKLKTCYNRIKIKAY